VASDASAEPVVLEPAVLEPVVSAPAIGIEASAEPTPSATDRVLIRPTARKGRLPSAGAEDPLPDDVTALFSIAMAIPVSLRFPASKSSSS
jgi:hypothetical protein